MLDDAEDDVHRIAKSQSWFDNNSNFAQSADRGDITASKHVPSYAISQLSYWTFVSLLNRLKYDSHAALIRPRLSRINDYYAHKIASDELADYKAMTARLVCLVYSVDNLCNEVFDGKPVEIDDMKVKINKL